MDLFCSLMMCDGCSSTLTPTTAGCKQGAFSTSLEQRDCWLGQQELAHEAELGLQSGELEQ